MGAEQGGNEGFDNAVTAAGEHHSPGAGDATEIATAKALIPNNVPISDDTLNKGAINIPAPPAKTLDTA